MKLGFLGLHLVLAPLMMLAAMAFYTLFERKFLAHVQLRKGPNKVSFMGLMQPLADALKLFTKQQPKPFSANGLGFFMAPAAALGLSLILVTLYPSLFLWHVVPFTCLFFLVVSSLNVYPTLVAGWASNSKYALLGTVRGIAQTISYEISMGLLLLGILSLSMSFYFFPQMFGVSVPLAVLVPPLAITWFVTILAEANRTPFDFVEGESELVSGFNVEYAAGGFALLFMAEYTSILVLSLLTSALLFLAPVPTLLQPVALSVAGVGVAAAFVWVRATLPRMRYDQMMMLTWKSILPFSLCLLVVVPAFMGVVS